MKTRESGMPAETLWQTFFEPASILQALGLGKGLQTVVDLGCGYGTFAIPAAQISGATVYAFDLDDQFLAECTRKAQEAGLPVICQKRDFIADGTGLADGAVDYVMLFNILHAEQPLTLLQEAYRILSPQGQVGVIHWNYDPGTPRGPSMDIRPHPEQCQAWMRTAGFELSFPFIDLPPYHYGLVGVKPTNK